MNATSRFLSSVFSSPIRTGAIAPTSRRTALDFVRVGRINDVGMIIELGAGTGVVTRQILAHKPKGARVLAIERNPDFKKFFPEGMPDLTVVCDCASRLTYHVGILGLPKADRVFCSLPWALLGQDATESILRQSLHVLADRGAFLTLVSYGTHWLPSGRKLRSALESTFGRVHRHPVRCANLPPVFFYECSARI